MVYTLYWRGSVPVQKQSRGWNKSPLEQKLEQVFPSKIK
jgi:hypothetical protein